MTATAREPETLESLISTGAAFLATPPPHTGSRLRLIAAILKEVLGLRGDPDIAQERYQIHVSRKQSNQQLTYILKRFDQVSTPPTSGLKSRRDGSG